MKITVSLEKVLPRIHSHLSIIGKRAVNQHGERFYEELTTSVHEDSVFADLMCSASESIVSAVSDVCVFYEDSEGVTFEIVNERWAKLDEKLSHDLTEALEGSIYRYIVFYCLGVFLSSIFPALSQEKFPTFGKTYLDMAEGLLKRIVDLSYLKRADNFAGLAYDEMFRASSEEFEGHEIGLFTIQRNGITISSYNGTADKTADILVPVNVSELKNDSGYLKSITSELVCGALGYTPFDEDAFTKSNIREIAEIPSWVWGEKPKYAWTEIGGLDTELDKKLDVSDFREHFDETIRDYSLGHEFSIEGSGQYISGFREDGDRIIFQKSAFPDFSSDNVSWGSVTDGGIVLTIGGVSYALAFAGQNNESYFKKVRKDGADWIMTEYPLYSTGDISAFGASGSEMGGGGVSKFESLTDVINAGIPEEGQVWGWNGSQYAWLDAPKGSDVDLSDYVKKDAVRTFSIYNSDGTSLLGYFNPLGDYDQEMRLAILTADDLKDYVQAGDVKTMTWSYYDADGNKQGYTYNPLGETKGELDITAGLVSAAAYNEHVTKYNTFVEKFDSMFAIVDGKIEAKLSFYSTGDISAYGDADSQIPSAEVSVIPVYTGGTHIATINGTEIYAPEGGGTADLEDYAKIQWVNDNFLTEPELETWIGDKGYATEGFVDSKAEEYADKALADAKIYADTNFVNLGSWQEITGQKAFKAYQSFDGGLSTDTINILSQYPLITFGGTNADDYSVRLYNSYAGLLEIQDRESDYGPRLKIGGAVLSYDSDNHALKVSDINGAGSINLYATGDVAAFSGLGSGFDTLTDLTLTNKLTANALNIGNGYGITCEIDKYGDYQTRIDYLTVENSFYANDIEVGYLTIGENIVFSKTKTTIQDITTGAEDETQYVDITINGSRYRISATKL